MWSSRMLCTPCAIILCISSILQHVQAQNPPSVQTSLGLVTGKIETSPVTYYSYKGIPYATVIGRFKAPIPITEWKQTIVADKDGPICPQLIISGSADAGADQSEDCLFMNIYTPLAPDATASKLPVLVWIHGGAFIQGSGSSRLFGPQFFMLEGGIVLVTFNYRLGLLGFLSIGTQDAQGNAGMKDQVEALKWVKREISNFGGDADRITIFGQSAGAASVIHHILSPMSKGLFHRAIAESGSALADWANIDANEAHERATRIARNLGCDSSNTTLMVKCFNQMPVSAILNASEYIFTEHESIQKFLVFSPVIETKIDEDVFLADYSVNMLNNLSITVPLIIGTNKDEALPLLSDKNGTYAWVDRNLQYFVPRTTIRQISPDQLNALGQKLRDFYFSGGPVNLTTLTGYVNIFTDQLFMYPTVKTVRKLVEKKTGDVYLYCFAYDGGYKYLHQTATKLGYQGVAHSDELGYLFYSNVLKQDLTNKTSDDYKTMQKMVKLWKAFATTGEPVNTSDTIIKSIQWAKVTNASELKYLEMKTVFRQVQDYYKERIALWDQLVPPSSSSYIIQPTMLLTLVSILFTLK